MVLPDWIMRAAMLVLAGLVSLSIIGAIAAIPSGVIESRIGIGPEGREPTRQVAPIPEKQQPSAGGAETATPGAGRPGAAPAADPAPASAADPGEWLEANTYALLALVGLATAMTLLLWRGVRERRRMADALEMIAARWS